MAGFSQSLLINQHIHVWGKVMYPFKLKPLIASISLISCCVVYAQGNLSEGTQEFGLQGLVDFDHKDDYLVNLTTSYGYFIRQDWEIGGVLDVNASGAAKNFAFGGFTEYNFSNQSNWTPYIGVAAQVATLKIDDETSSMKGKDATAFQFTGKLGIKYFINQNVAISVEVNHAMATDDVNFQGEGGVKKSLTRLLLGTRFYY